VGETAGVSTVAVALLEGVASALGTTVTATATTRTGLTVVGEAAGISTVAVTLLVCEASTTATAESTTTATTSSGLTIVGEAARISTVAVTLLVREAGTAATTTASVGVGSLVAVGEAASITASAVALLEGVALRGSAVHALLLGLLARFAAGRRVVEALVDVPLLIFNGEGELFVAVTAVEHDLLELAIAGFLFVLGLFVTLQARHEVILNRGGLLSGGFLLLGLLGGLLFDHRLGFGFPLLGLLLGLLGGSLLALLGGLLLLGLLLLLLGGSLLGLLGGLLLLGLLLLLLGGSLLAVLGLLLLLALLLGHLAISGLLLLGLLLLGLLGSDLFFQFGHDVSNKRTSAQKTASRHSPMPPTPQAFHRSCTF